MLQRHFFIQDGEIMLKLKQCSRTANSIRDRRLKIIFFYFDYFLKLRKSLHSTHWVLNWLHSSELSRVLEDGIL